METDQKKLTWPRLIRVLFSTVCGVTCLLVTVLWVRSYWIQDTAFLRIPGQTEYSVSNVQGLIYYDVLDIRTNNNRLLPGDRYLKHEPVLDAPISLFQKEGKAAIFPKLFCWTESTEFTIASPHWLIVLVAAGMAAVPSLRGQFRVGTLLLITAIVAAALGILFAR